MDTTIWTYPWDVADVGVAQTVSEVSERAGAGGISLAVSYHAGRFLQARSPRRKIYFPEDGTVYFKPDPNRYAGLLIQPSVAAMVHEQGDVLRQLESERQRKGIRLNAWTVCLHNTRIGMAHPAVAVRNAFGDPHYFSLCPSHPEARAYVSALVADMTHNYHLDSVELESPTFMGVVHGYHHEKDEVGLTPRENFLLGLCFCEHCLTRASRSGVNAEAARRSVRHTIEEACSRALPVPGAAPSSPDDFTDLPAVSEYLAWRFEPVTSLLAELREAANPRTTLHLLTGPVAGAWRSGLDIAAAARILDGLVVLAYDQPPEGAADVTTAAVKAASGKFVSAAFRLAHPEQAGPADLAAKVAAAANAGARGLHFYNYGLVPAARLDWIRQATHALP